MQVASMEWFLGVQIQDFMNLYNVQIINGNYCCCDDSGNCTRVFDDLLTMCKEPSTTQVCGTYFLVPVKKCLSISTCSLSKTYQLNYTSSVSTFDHGILSIPLKEMELSNQVSTKISYFLKLQANIESLQPTV